MPIRLGCLKRGDFGLLFLALASLTVLLTALVLIPAASSPAYVPKGAVDELGTVIGIDFGRTTSRVAVYRNQSLEIIRNDDGGATTPSWLGLADYDLNSCFETNVNDAAAAIHHALSPNYGHVYVERTDQSCDGNAQCRYNNEIHAHPTFQDLAGPIFRKLKQSAEDHLGENVTHAVIAVPLYFNDNHRLAIREAARQANLTTLRIFNDHTMVAIAGRLDTLGGESYALVFQLGRTTMDVTLLAIDDGILEALSHVSDSTVGGNQFDSRIVDFFARRYFERTGVDVTRDRQVMGRLRRVAEEIKWTLSSQEFASVQIESFVNGEDFSDSLTRATFEELNRDLFEKSLNSVTSALQEANVTAEQIDYYVLAGASTQIPFIKRLLKDHFDGKDPLSRASPEDAVVHGAAYQGARLSSQTGEKPGCSMSFSPWDLGIESVGGIFNPFIRRPMTLPARSSRIVTTVRDNQSSVVLSIFEGDYRLTKYNNFVGAFEVSGIPPSPRGVPEVEVTFVVPEDDVDNVSVTALNKLTGKLQVRSIAIEAINEADLYLTTYVVHDVVDAWPHNIAIYTGIFSPSTHDTMILVDADSRERNLASSGLKIRMYTRGRYPSEYIDWLIQRQERQQEIRDLRKEVFTAEEQLVGLVRELGGQLGSLRQQRNEAEWSALASAVDETFSWIQEHSASATLDDFSRKASDLQQAAFQTAVGDIVQNLSLCSDAAH